MAAQKKAKLPNEPNLKMPFFAKTLAFSHFHPFSKQVKNGKKVSISCRFQTVFILFRVVYRSKQPDWIRPTHNRIKRRLQSLSLFGGRRSG